MSADRFAYEDGKWEVRIVVQNPDGTRQEKTMSFDVQEGAKVYTDMHEPVVSWRYVDDYISSDRLQEIWNDG